MTLATGYVVQECKDSYEASITLQLIPQLDDIQGPQWILFFYFIVQSLIKLMYFTTNLSNKSN